MNIRLDPFRVFHWRLILTSTLCSRVIKSTADLCELEKNIEKLREYRRVLWYQLSEAKRLNVEVKKLENSIKANIDNSTQKISNALKVLESIAFDVDTILMKDVGKLKKMIKKGHNESEKRIRKIKKKKISPKEKIEIERRIEEIKKACAKSEGDFKGLIGGVARLFYGLLEESRQLETGAISPSLVKEMDMRGDPRLMELIKRNIIEADQLEKQLISLRGKNTSDISREMVEKIKKELSDLNNIERFDKKLIHRLKGHIINISEEAKGKEFLKGLSAELSKNKQRFNKEIRKIKTQELRAYLMIR